MFEPMSLKLHEANNKLKKVFKEFKQKLFSFKAKKFFRDSIKLECNSTVSKLRGHFNQVPMPSFGSLTRDTFFSKTVVLEVIYHPFATALVCEGIT